MASELIKRPLLVGALLIIAGILLYAAYPSLAVALSLVVLSMIFGVVYLLRQRFAFTIDVQSALLYSVSLSLVMALGAFLPYASDHALGVDQTHPRDANIDLMILGSSVSKPNRVRYDAQVQSGCGVLSGRRVMLFVDAADSSLQHIVAGVRLRANVRIRGTGDLLSSTSSGSFARYLLSRRMSAVCYTRGNIELLPSSSGRISVGIYAQRLKQRLIRTLEVLPLKHSDRSALATLCLGRSDVGEMERDLQGRYASLGASHLLAVSGFHLAVVVSFVMLLCYPLRRFRWGGFFVHLIPVVFAWLFTFITGMSEPTVRAALMISFLLLGRWTGRPIDRTNLLAASAICILIHNPYAIYSIGFSLSYIAVCSIILFYPLVYHLIRDISNPLFRHLWSVFCIGLSVQFLSSPLCLYFFGTNALLGIFINVPLTLLALLLIPAGLFWMFVSLVLGGIPVWTGHLVSFFVRLNGRIVESLSDVRLPTLDYRPHFAVVFFLWVGLIYIAFCWHRYAARQRLLGR